MATLKELLAKRPDVMTKSFKLSRADGVEITIRRLKVKERDALLVDRPTDEKDLERGAKFSLKLVKLGMVEPTVESEEELLDLPATVIEEIARHILEFNGWSERGRALLEDQFRAQP